MVINSFGNKKFHVTTKKVQHAFMRHPISLFFWVVEGREGRDF
jgi:hypothetical protein